MDKPEEDDRPQDDRKLRDEEPDLDLGWDEDENEERRRDPLRNRLPA